MKIGKLFLTAALALTTVLGSAVFVSAAQDPFMGDDEINIVYLGGSITQGSGASDKNTTSWAAKLGKYMQDTYQTPQRTVNNYNEGVGGTPSGYGMARLCEDVISHDPDLVFIEFCVNDKYYTKEQIETYMESMVLTLQQIPTKPYVVFVCTTEEHLNTDSQYHKEIAEYYNIPVVDLKEAIKNDSDITISELFKDGTHPNDAGHQYYYEKIRQFMENPGSYRRPQLKDQTVNKYSKPVYGKRNKAGLVTSYTGMWKKNGDAIKIEGENMGELTFDFVGDTLCLAHYIGKSGGRYSLYIDGSYIRDFDSYNAGVARNISIAATYSGLGKTKHTLKIVKLETPNAKSLGNTVEIGYFLTEDSDKVIQGVDLLDANGTKTDALTAGEMNILYVTMQNLNDEPIDSKGVVAVYDENGVLTGVSSMTKTIEAQTTDNFAIGFTSENGVYAKAYLWDGINSMKAMDISYKR